MSHLPAIRTRGSSPNQQSKPPIRGHLIMGSVMNTESLSKPGTKGILRDPKGQISVPIYRWDCPLTRTSPGFEGDAVLGPIQVTPKETNGAKLKKSAQKEAGEPSCSRTFN